MSNSPSAATSQVIGRYVVEHELGRGATSIVYAARDRNTTQQVALKLLRPELSSSSAAERFLREIGVTMQLDHPHIVPLLDSGEADGKLYCVMPVMEGGTLRQRLAREKQLPIDETIQLGETIARALHFAHARNLLHRDVKPENILFTSGRACLGDFGIARALVRATGESTTSTGLVRGTPAYMSPEQAAGDRAYDGRSDIYSLACVLYEALAGVPTFVGATSAAILGQRFSHAPRPVGVFRRSVPPELEQVLERALAIDPADRFRTAEEFADALRAAAPVSGVTSDAHRRSSRRRRMSGAIAASVAVILLSGAGAAVARYGPFGGTATTGSVLDPRRIAVLYFDDHSADKSLGYLASGLTESLIHELANVPGITVISRNGVKPFRDRAAPVDSLVRALRVGSLVDGSVQRSNDRVRLTVQLIDAATHVPASTTLERTIGDVFLLEDDLAQRVAALLRKRIGAELRVRERASATRSVRARELVWRADRLREEADTIAASRDTVDLRRALVLSRRTDSLLVLAATADPRWIEPTIDRGWVALEIALRHTGALRDAAFDSSIAYANRALQRDSTNASALELRGTSLYFRADRGLIAEQAVATSLMQANADLERAIARDSARASAWGTLSRVRNALGDVDDAERKANAALAMDSYLKDARSILFALFGATLLNDRVDASWRWCRRGAGEYPQDVRFVTCQLTLMAEDMSKPPDAPTAERLVAAANRLDPPERAGARGKPWLPVYREMMLAVTLARAGAKDSARAIAARAERNVAHDNGMRVDLDYEMALLELNLGNPERSLDFLANFLRARPYLRKQVSTDPRWKRLQRDAAFRALIDAVKS